MRFLKWIVFLPLAIVASFIAVALVNLGGQLIFGWFKATSAIMCIASGFFGAVTLSTVAQKIAPRNNRIVRSCVIASLIILGGLQVINFFVDLGFTGNMILSKLSLRYAQAFIGIGMLFGALMIRDEYVEDLNKGGN